jgi:tetratricopeptide (TPR) repeat protein
LLIEGLLLVQPRNALLFTCLGCVCLLEKRDDRALEYFDRALDLDPTDITARTYAGELRLKRGENQRALAHFEAAIALDPEGKSAFANRARVLYVRATVPPRAAEQG